LITSTVWRTTLEPFCAQASFCTDVAWAASAADCWVLICAVMSLANFTTLYRRPWGSKIGLYEASRKTTRPCLSTRSKRCEWYSPRLSEAQNAL